MKTYRESMNELQFSPQQKQEMIDRLTAQSARPPRGRAIPLRRVCALGAAAVLTGALCLGAAASGVLKPAAQAFGVVFGTAPAQTEIIDQIGHPLDARATVDGVTVQTDAIIGDTYSYAIVYTIAREDGAPLADALEPLENGLLPLVFTGTADTDVGYMGGAHGASYFYDADPTDNAVQYVQQRTADRPIEPGTARAKFSGLSVYTDGDYSTREVVARGPWKITFDFAFEDSSLSLPAGQSFTLNGMDATLDAVTLSPLSILVDYTVHSQVQWDENQTSGQQSEHDRDQSYRYFESLPVLLTLKDGTTLDLSGAGGSISPGNGETVCQKGNLFDEILSLDQVESVTVADLTLPVEQ